MKVNPVHPATPPPVVEPVSPIIRDHGGDPWMAAGDVVEISTVAKLAAKIHEIPEIRADLVARVKAQIEAGTYETQERLEITIDRLMQELTA